MRLRAFRWQLALFWLTLASSVVVRAEEPEEVALETMPDIDLANVVTSAAKSVTTVQEVPAIVTVITAEDIQRRGLRHIDDVLANVPGWVESAIHGNSIPLPMVRGVPQAALLLHDGVSMFEPWINWPNFNRSQSLETLKRIEVVTGPGGVLWGANSFLGIVNLISKDAEDVKGLEMSAGYGDGPGDKQDFRAWALFGKVLFGGKLKIFQHLSYETYVGEVWRLPVLVLPWAFAPAAAPDPQRSWMVTVDGKYSVGPVSLYYSIPFATMYSQLGLTPSVSAHREFTVIDRYGILEYKQRFLADRITVDARGYYAQFVRDAVQPLYPESPIFPAYKDEQGRPMPGGFTIIGRGSRIQRFGAMADADFSLLRRLRLLTGVEAFNESVSNSDSQIALAPSTGYGSFVCPLNSDGSPVSGCPLTVVHDVNRTVLAGYVDLQWHPLEPLILEGGVRLQAAVGPRPYALTPLYSASAAWGFAPGYHLKLNYATGFRPPVFNNTDSTSTGLNWGANPNLLNETSQAFQAELNGRVLRNRGVFREVELRVDYAYTLLDNLIEITGTIFNAAYSNSGRRSTHSVEALARAYFVGDHFVELGYTYLDAVSSTIGNVRNSPSQWFTTTLSLSLVRRRLDLNGTVRVYASFLDSNRYPAHPGGVPGTVSSAGSTDVTFDRVSPVAVVQLGVRLRLFGERLLWQAQVYNALNQRYWLPDAVNEMRPNEQSMPIPAAGISFFSSVVARAF